MKNEFKSNDFYQAVVLKTAGLPLVRLEQTTGRFFNFVFNDSDNLAESILLKFWNKQMKVDAKSFVENINEIKARIHSGL